MAGTRRINFFPRGGRRDRNEAGERSTAVSDKKARGVTVSGTANHSQPDLNLSVSIGI